MSPYDSKERKKRKSRPSKFMSGICARSVLGMRARGWWAAQSVAVRTALKLMLLAATLTLLSLYGTSIIAALSGERSVARPHSPGLGGSTIPLHPGSGRKDASVLSRIRKLVKKLGRDVGLLARPDRRLGEFGVGGAGARVALAEPLASQAALHGRELDPTLPHVPLMTHLLSRDLFARHLASQADAVAAQRADAEAVALSHGETTPRWTDNPWTTRPLASVTLFATFPDLNPPGSSSLPAGAQSTQLSLHLLVLSSWVELVPAARVLIYVNSAETCLQLVGHDGSELGRAAAMEMARRDLDSRRPANALAAVQCRVFPCVHQHFRRGMMHCVWDDAHANASDELQRRKERMKAERVEALQMLLSTRPLSEGGQGAVVRDAAGVAVLYSPQAEAELLEAIDAVDHEDELLLYLAPQVLFDMQLLTAISKLSHDAAAVRDLLRAHADRDAASASDTPFEPPSLGLDMNGVPIPDTGHFLAVGRRTDISVPAEVLRALRPGSVSQPDGSVAGATAPTQPLRHSSTPSSSFHSPLSNFPSLVLDALETIWRSAYATGDASTAQLHSPYGIDFLAMRVSTYAALQQEHEERLTRERLRREDEEEQDPAGAAAAAAKNPEQQLLRHYGIDVAAVASGLNDAEMRLLSSSLPPVPTPTRSSRGTDASKASFFPPFLAGLFRWENWFLSRMIMRRGSDHSNGGTRPVFEARVVDLSASATLLRVEIAAAGVDASSADGSDATVAEGARFNEILARALTGNAYRVGAVDSAPFVSVGSCVLERNRLQQGNADWSRTSTAAAADTEVAVLSPTLLPPLCSVVPRPASNFSSLYWFTRQASRAPLPVNYIVVLTVNTGYMQLALNWLCWARRIRFESFILLAEDQNSARVFRALGAPVIVPSDAEETLPPSDYGSVAFQRTMSFRTEFLAQVLQAGFHFVTADMDALWFDDPIAYFDATADLSGQPHKGNKLSGGFVVVRSSPQGRSFWSRVVECQRQNAVFLARHEVGTYEPSAYTEQYCINELSLALEARKDLSPPFRRTLLDPLQFPDGKSFFDQHLSQYAGVPPVVIHNNWITSTGAKFRRMQQWGMVCIAEAGPDGKDGLQHAMEAGSIANAHRGVTLLDAQVCSAVPLVRRAPVPAPLALASPTAASALALRPRGFHLHVRVFLSDSCSDGVDQADEFSHLRRTVHALMDADYRSVRDALGQELHPALHVEIMLDHFAHADAAGSRAHKAELAEFERLRAELKSLKQAWNTRFGEPDAPANAHRFVLEVKRPRSPALGKAKRVGKLGLWSMPWPKVPVSAAAGVNTAASQQPDVSLYLQDSVFLSPHWFTFAHALLSEYYFAPSPSPSEAGAAAAPSPFFDPRVYGVSLLDEHQVLGESRSQSFVPGSAHTESLFSSHPYFNASTGAWRRVRHYAAQQAETARVPGSVGPVSAAEIRARLPSSFLQHRVFGFQALTRPDALIWLPDHFNDWTRWLAQQHAVDPLETGAATTVHAAATQCVPTLASNRDVHTAPSHRSWHQWLNRWSYERGFYPLHTRTTLMQVTGAAAADVRALAAGRGAPPLRVRAAPMRHSVALTPEQAASGEVQLMSQLTPSDLFLPPPAAVPVFDFHLARVRQPVTLPHRALLAPPSLIDQCYTMDQLADKLAINQRKELEALEIERARRRAEKEKKAAADKAKAEKIKRGG